MFNEPFNGEMLRIAMDLPGAWPELAENTAHTA